MVVLTFVVLKTQKLSGLGGGGAVVGPPYFKGRMIKWRRKSKQQKPQGYWQNWKIPQTKNRIHIKSHPEFPFLE